MFAEEVDYRLLSQHTRRARKEHKCVMCKDPIKPGSLYTHIAYLQDGQFFADNFHGGICPQDKLLYEDNQ